MKRRFLALLTMGAVLGLAPAAALSSPIAGYQLGAFTEKANAETFLKVIVGKGFYAEIHGKSVNGKSFWIVFVPVSDIPFEDMRQKLADAGIPSITVPTATLTDKLW